MEMSRVYFKEPSFQKYFKIFLLYIWNVFFMIKKFITYWNAPIKKYSPKDSIKIAEVMLPYVSIIIGLIVGITAAYIVLKIIQVLNTII